MSFDLEYHGYTVVLSWLDGAPHWEIIGTGMSFRSSVAVHDAINAMRNK
jgi:hypothetical protein